jgi:hypothetical protein
VEDRVKSSLMLDKDIWTRFKAYSVAKHGSARAIYIEAEKAFEEYMENHPLQEALLKSESVDFDAPREKEGRKFRELLGNNDPERYKDLIGDK